MTTSDSVNDKDGSLAPAVKGEIDPEADVIWLIAAFDEHRKRIGFGNVDPQLTDAFFSIPVKHYDKRAKARAAASAAQAAAAATPAGMSASLTPEGFIAISRDDADWIVGYLKGSTNPLRTEVARRVEHAVIQADTAAHNAALSAVAGMSVPPPTTSGSPS